MRIWRKHIIITLLLVFCAWANAQNGEWVEQFLNLPSGARQAALGGYNVSLYDGDLNIAFANPALLSPASHNEIGFNYTNMFADINLATVMYGRQFGEKNVLAFGVEYVDYGTFKGIDEYNVYSGRFTAKDIALSVTYCRVLWKGFSVGATIKPLYSIYEHYHSGGIGFDMGVSYHNEDKGVDAGLALKNVGFWSQGYKSIDGVKKTESLPINLLFGVSYKIPKLPFRLSVTFHNMQTWDLSATTSAIVTDKMASKSKSARGADMFFRHTIFSLEILPAKYLYLVASYNHRHRMDMVITGTRSVAGFAFGAGVNIKNYKVGFSIVPYQAGSLGYNLTYTMNLSDFGVK